MFNNIYNLIIKILSSRFDNFSNISYAQEGEDMILNRLFETKKKGYYVDIGAHHPKRFSNTYYLKIFAMG